MAGFRKRGYVKAASLDPAEIEEICRKARIGRRSGSRGWRPHWRTNLTARLLALFEPAPTPLIKLPSTGPDWKKGAHAAQGDFDIEAQMHPPTRRPLLSERALGGDVMARHGWRRE